MLELNQWLPCDPAGQECGAAVSAATDTRPYQVIFVSPRTEPRVSAPLGWVLSTASQDALNAALDEEKQPSSGCANVPPPHACQPGVGRLADLLEFIKGG
jgi:hypothetical protein